MSATREPRPPADRFCDLVLEGGVTSGIVYAAAVHELSKEYRFARIGGSSIGAFAAALAAAAEYARRQGATNSFDRLGLLPEQLAEEDDSGRTVLERLFRPQPGTRRLFEVFRAGLGDRRRTAKLFAVLGAAARQYLRLAVLGTLALLLVAALPLFVRVVCASARACTPPAPWPADAVLTWFGTTLVLAALVFLALPWIGIVVDLCGAAVRNGFGLCRGWEAGSDGSEDPDLAGYLHRSIQRLAGLDTLADAPLTFRDLHEAPGGPDTRFGAADRPRRSIALEVYATNLSHGRPYRFPLDAPGDPQRDMGRLFFRLKDLERYFPAPVMHHLKKFGRPYQPASPADPPPSPKTAGLLELPSDDLPIVVAARLAMSFPLLISAVPLHAIDHEPERARREVKRCWFSDGGLCSNFPIHLFDCFLPRWPTFGISLGTRNAFQRSSVWLPDKHFEGRGDTWHRGMEADRALALDPGGAARLFAFLVGLWKATWRWNDTTMMRMPGVRDRVVRVLLEPGDGGVNIRMSSGRIRHLADHYGRQAGRDFVAKFTPPGRGWDEHRWVRFNTLLIALRERLHHLGDSADFARHTQPLPSQIERARQQAPLRGHSQPQYPPEPSEMPLTPPQAHELIALLRALLDLEKRFAEAPDSEPYRARPRPVLRMRHPT